MYDETKTCSAAFRKKEEADVFALNNRLACIKVDLDFEEGEGL